MSMTVGEMIRRLRAERNWSQTELAERSGLTLSAISKFEIGQRQPQLESALAIVRALEVSLAVFDQCEKTG